MTAIIFSRAIGPVPIQVVVSEQPESVLEITEIPIEDGSAITDHAYSAPFRISLDVLNGGLALTYQDLVRFQKTRTPFTYVSGFDVHRDLLIKRIAPERDAAFSNTFSGRIDLQEVIIVGTASVAGDGEGSGQSSGGRESKGGPNRPGGKESRRAAPPAAHRAGDAATQNRAGGTVQRGDARTNSVDPARRQSLINGWFE